MFELPLKDGEKATLSDGHFLAALAILAHEDWHMLSRRVVAEQGWAVEDEQKGVCRLSGAPFLFGDEIARWFLDGLNDANGYNALFGAAEEYLKVRKPHGKRCGVRFLADEEVVGLMTRFMATCAYRAGAYDEFGNPTPETLARIQAQAEQAAAFAKVPRLPDATKVTPEEYDAAYAAAYGAK